MSKNLENREEKEKWKYNSTARERKIWVISSRDFLKIETLVNDWSGIPHLHNLLSTFNPQRIQDDWNKFQRQHFWFYPTIFWLSFLPKNNHNKKPTMQSKKKGKWIFFILKRREGKEKLNNTSQKLRMMSKLNISRIENVVPVTCVSSVTCKQGFLCHKHVL